MDDQEFEQDIRLLTRLIQGCRFPLPSEFGKREPADPHDSWSLASRSPFIGEYKRTLEVILNSLVSLVKRGGIPCEGDQVQASMFQYQFVTQGSPSLPPEKARLAYNRHQASFLRPTFLVGFPAECKEELHRVMRMYPACEGESRQGLAGECLRTGQPCLGDSSDANFHSLDVVENLVTSVLAIPLVAYHCTTVLRIRYSIGALCLSSNGLLLPADAAALKEQPLRPGATRFPRQRLAQLRFLGKILAELLVFRAFLLRKNVSFFPLQRQVLVQVGGVEQWLSLGFEPGSGLVEGRVPGSDKLYRDDDDDGVIEVEGQCYAYNSAT